VLRTLILDNTDFRHARKGVPHLKVSGKGGKTRYLPLHPGTHGLINDYLDAAGHGLDEAGALFRPVRNNRTGRLEAAITADGVYKLVRAYSAQLGFAIGAHALRATAATNALDHQADIAKVQEWLGHANIATTRIYYHRRTRPEDSPTFKVAY
jgi:integrase/recombinase XerD